MTRKIILTAFILGFAFQLSAADSLLPPVSTPALDAAIQTPVPDSSLAFEYWTRQNYENQKRQELVSLLDRMVGLGKAGVYTHFDWAQPDGSAALNPTRVAVTVVLDKSVQEAEAAMVKDVAVRVLNLSPDRGDQMEIYQMARRQGFMEIVSDPQNVLDLFKFLFLITLVLLVLSSVNRASKQITLSFEKLAEETRNREIAIQVASKASLASPAPGGRMQESRPAASLTGQTADPEALAAILEQENSRSIALYISTLDPESAGRVLANLSPSKQEEVALMISQMEGDPDPREVAQMQSQIQLKLRKVAR